jgi:cyclase
VTAIFSSIERTPSSRSAAAGDRVLFTPGVQQVRGRCHAWLQPDGGWGLSNAGLIVGNGESLLVDTLFDLVHTRRMLDAMVGLTSSAPVRTVVNTHGNGDHWFGNELLAGVEIIASEATVDDMRAIGPDAVLGLMAIGGATGDYAREIFGRFDFTGICPTYPTRTFRGDLELTIGGVEVRLLEVGPAHTRGDTIVHCERDGVVYSGDIVFAHGTPIVWAGPVDNWIAACERILELGAEHVVPGHGPVCGAREVRAIVDYLQFVQGEASIRFAAGMPAQEAALDINLGPFAGLPESERLALNVAVVYRELDLDPGPPPPAPALFSCMAELRHRQSREG